MLDYPALAAVGCVIREGSFERAANVLGITPSAVSQRIRGLEERLGAILVVRGQPCEATELGRALCVHLDRVRMLESDVAPILRRGLRDEGQPVTLRIAVNADSLATWFPPAVAAMGREDGVLLDVTLEDEGRTADRLLSGDVLAAVTARSAPIQGCRTTALGALRYAACASPGFLARHFPRGVDASSLAQAPYLRFERSDDLQQRWARETLGIGLPACAHYIPSTHGFVALALEGLGWGMQPMPLVEAHLEAGRLVELVPERRMDVQLHWTVTRLQASALGRLSEAVKASARSLHRGADRIGSDRGR